MSLTLCEDFPTLSGRQEPHHISIFPGDFTQGERCLKFAALAGAKSMPWQRSAQLSICATRPDGQWTHATFCLLCTRQNGKSEILIHRCLFGLFKLGETILYTAQRWKTARDGWGRLMSLIRANPSLSRRVKRTTCSQGEGIVELDNGASISFGVRSNDSGRGLTDVDLIIYDEAYNLTDGEIAAMSFTQMAAKNPQRIYASSAVNAEQHPNGHVLAGIRRAGIAGAPRLGFMEWWAPDGSCACRACVGVEPMDREDEATHRYANPSYGVIMTADKIADLMVNMQTVAGRKSFDVEALGRGDWPVDQEVHDPVIPSEVWHRMAALTTRSGPVAVAVDRTPDREWWSIAAAQRTDDGRVHLEVGYFQQAQPESVVDALLDIVAAWDPCAIAIDAKSTANVLRPLLVDTGIEPEMTNSTQIGEACGGFLDAATGGRLAHSDQPVLTAAVAEAVKRPSKTNPQQFTWDTSSGAVIAPLVAATLAHWALLTFGVVVAKPAKPGVGRAPNEFDNNLTAASGHRSNLNVLTAAW